MPHAVDVGDPVGATLLDPRGVLEERTPRDDLAFLEPDSDERGSSDEPNVVAVERHLDELAAFRRGIERQIRHPLPIASDRVVSVANELLVAQRKKVLVRRKDEIAD